MIQKKFSKDPRVQLISIEQFFEQSNYLSDISKDNLWCEDELLLGTYYKITPRFLIQIDYVSTTINFGMDDSTRIEKIYVAYHDGKTEYGLFDSKLKTFFEEKNHRKAKEQIKRLQTGKELLDKTQ